MTTDQARWDAHALAIVDKAIAERDSLRSERDRLRREVEALLEDWSDLDPGAVHGRLEAILWGES
jgi:hypothetical protein